MGFEITKVYKEHFPALRLIGKRYTNADRGPDGFARFWCEWTAPGGRFDELKKLGPSDAVEYGYIGLMTNREEHGEILDFTYWIGMFFPAGTTVPEGFDYLDLPESDIGVAWIYGDDRTGEIFGQATHCASLYALRDNGMGRLNPNAGGEGAIVYFERYSHRYAARDEQGKVILDYGFYIAPSSQPNNVQREEGRVRLTNVPAAAGGGNGYVRGLETLLICEGASADSANYERLMGLSGMAFILMVDSEHRWEGKVDAGWWPLDTWGLKLRHDFLSRAVGYELKVMGLFYDFHKWTSDNDSRDAYLKQIHPEVVRQINAGRPALEAMDFGFVITGYDEDTAADHPPAWGRCAVETAEGNGCYSKYWPFGVLMVGKRLDPMNPDEADLAALRHAVALAHDQAGPTEAQWRDRRFTGQKAWAAWAALLRNEAETLEDRHHWNVRGYLTHSRTAAIAYLKSVAQRRDGQAAEELLAAAAVYEKVMELVNRFDFNGLSSDMTKRRQQADAIDHIAALEQEAITHIERAIAAMK